MKLFLRSFAQCPGVDAAVAIEVRLREELKQWHPTSASHPTPYWKIPGQFEFTFNLMPATQAAFEAITNITLDGWQKSEAGESERWATWNRTASGFFLAPEVTWANLELLEV